MNIYVGVVWHGRRSTRYVVLAENAAGAEAEIIACEKMDAESVEVGRLGVYDPGMAGARLAPTKIIAIQRPPV